MVSKRKGILLALLSLLLLIYFYFCGDDKESNRIWYYKAVNESFHRVLLGEASRSKMKREKLLASYSDANYKEDSLVELKPLPTIFAVTPTFSRPQQIAELTRLSQTLMQVPNIHWIIGEDAHTISTRLQEFLMELTVPHTLLLTPMPDIYKQAKYKFKPKGVAARVAGMNWARNSTRKGVLYFMDDDNTYDLRVFEEMRWTKKVSMWPVGLVTGLALSSPILRDGRLVGWYDGYISGRKFPVDMAGFAVNLDFLRSRPLATMPFAAGREEDGFLKSLRIHPGDIEFKADECTKIYVWHTKTLTPKLASRMALDGSYNETNIQKLQNYLLIQPTSADDRTLDSNEIEKTFVVKN